MSTPIREPEGILGKVAMKWTSRQQKSLSSFAREMEWSGLLNGSHMDKLIGQGGVGSDFFSMIGSMVDAHKKWTSIMTWDDQAMLF
jgi:hypothetical protein